MADYSRYIPPRGAYPQQPEDEYVESRKRATLPPFEFNLPEDDPELAQLRKDIMLGGQERRRSNIDELSRAGLLGSSASFGVQQQTESDIARQLEGVAGSIYGRRRAESLGLYTGEQDFVRQLEIERLRALLQEKLGKMQQQGELLGGLGELAGFALGSI